MHVGASARRTGSGGVLAQWTLGLLGLLLFAGAILREAWPRLSSTVCRRTPADLSAIESALLEYRALHGDWPEDLDALIQPDERGHRLLADRTVSGSRRARSCRGRATRRRP